jgi:hypothetical protein
MGDHDVCPSCGGQSLSAALPGCATPFYSHPPEVDLFGPGPAGPPPMPIHTITVTHVAYDDPAEGFGIEPSDLGYEIEHGACPWRGDDCLVEEHVREMGLHQALFGVWDKGEGDNRLVTERVYRVRGWVSKTPATPNGPEEYDAGIEQVGTSELVTELPEGSMVIDSLTTVQEKLVHRAVEQARAEANDDQTP